MRGRTRHRNRHRRRRTRRRRQRRRHHQRGGRVALSPAAFPPGGPYRIGGSTNGLGGGYYYKNNPNPYLPDPINVNTGVGRPRVGKSRVQRGGGFLAENIPGGTDLQQAWWQLENGVKNAYQTWVGGKQYMSPSPSIQPLGKTASGGGGGGDSSGGGGGGNLSQAYKDAQGKAAGYTATA